jgi:hypothetical protein
MRSLRCFRSRRWLGLCLSVALPGRAPAQTSPDSIAVLALRDYQAACAADGGHLWGRSLGGPLIVVDPRTRAAVANAQPPGGTFELTDGMWLGNVPDGIPTANFSLTWVGRRWAMVLLPLPQDRYERLALLVHESFHRIQDDLGLAGPDPLNPHLDERDGRYWLRLELRALAAALRGAGAVRDRAARDAMLFRRERQTRYPGADSLEAALELQEGLAEYTGARIALDFLRLPAARAAEQTLAFEGRPTYVRALGYGTGPALGLLLDNYLADWRRRIRREGFAAQLAGRLHFAPPRDLAQAAAAAAVRYQADSLATLEDARAAERARRITDLRASLIDGPVLLLRQTSLSRAFNPNTLMAFGPEGTVYPTGSFSAEWGKLEVESGGALVASDFTLLRIPAPTDTIGPVIGGKGWTLELSKGWSLRPGKRGGDFVLEQH